MLTGGVPWVDPMALRPLACGAAWCCVVVLVLLCGPAGVPGAGRPVLWGRAAWCARGRRPAREPSAPRAFGSARRLVVRPGPATAHGCRSQARPRVPRVGAAGEAGRWSETAVAFARSYLCGIETAIAFAGEKWLYLVQFSDAEVMPVSVVPCWGRAVVSSVSISPCLCMLCAKYFAMLDLAWVRARKSSPCKHKTCQKGQFRASRASFVPTWTGKVPPARPGLAAPQHSTTLTARPPSDVSLYFESMSLPV